MSDDRLQELIRSSSPRPATPVDAESLWRRGQRRNRRRRAGVTGALASVLVVSVAATAIALGGGPDEQVRTGEIASPLSDDPQTKERQPFEWGSDEHLLALADCVRAKGFDPVVDLEDGRVEVYVFPEDDPVPACERELDAARVVEAPEQVGDELPGDPEAERRSQEAESQRRSAAWSSFYAPYAALNECLADAGFRTYDTPTLELHLSGDAGWWNPYDALFGRPASPGPGEPTLKLGTEGQPGKDGPDAFQSAERACPQAPSG